MAVWLPMIKVVLPYVGPILHAAIPAFTKKKIDKVDASAAQQIVAQQISELQEAVNRNSEATRSLARAVEEAAHANDRALRQARLLAAAALGVAVVALGVAISVAV